MGFYDFINEKESKSEQAKRLRAELVSLFKGNKYKDVKGTLEYPDDTKLKVSKFTNTEIELAKIFARTKYSIKIDNGEVNLNFSATILPAFYLSSTATGEKKFNCTVQKFDMLEGTATLDGVQFKLDKATVSSIIEKSRYKIDSTEYFESTLSSNKEISDALKSFKDKKDSEQAEKDAKDAEKRKDVMNYVNSAAKKLNTTVDKIVYGADNKFLEIQEEVSDSDLKKIKELFDKYEFYSVYFDRNADIEQAEKSNKEILNKIGSIVKFKFHSKI